MYVCICNGIKDTHVKEAIDNGAENVKDIFAKQGCKPDCAKCFGCMRKALNQDCGNSCQKDADAQDLLAAE